MKRVLFLMLLLAQTALAQESSEADKPRAIDENTSAHPEANSEKESNLTHTAKPRHSRTEPSAQISKWVINKDLTLDIKNKSYVEDNFNRSLNLETPPSQRNFYLKIGTDLDAERINLQLKNVRGKASFHGSFQKLGDLLENHGNSILKSPDAKQNQSPQ